MPRAEVPERVEQIRMASIEELCERVRGELHSEDGTTRLDGPFGQAIADEAGSWSLEFVTSEQLAEGICSWLKDFGPRQDEDGEGTPAPADPSDGASWPPSSRGGQPTGNAPHAEDQEGAERSRVGGPSESLVCICTDADDPNDHRKDCPMWGEVRAT